MAGGARLGNCRERGADAIEVGRQQPIRVDRETAAQLLNKHYFKVSARSLERWSLTWRILNGRAHCETVDLFEIAETMLSDAPPVIGGRKVGS